MGGHVKICDFGLVKDLTQTCESQVGGMSPVYSPPELFDGKPNQHSDQYSLAIVYQEMLTGHRPFQGRTAAQLAAQHLHSPPDVSVLSLADQAIVARAISKHPLRRFAGCREFIKQLRNADRQTVNIAQAHWTTSSTQTPDKTLPFSGGLPSDSRYPTSQRAGESIVCHWLPSIRTFDQSNWLRPTLVIGIGGTAASVLRQLHRRLTDRFGTMRYVPALQMLLLDTDPQNVPRIETSEQETLSEKSMLYMPLRSAKDYHEKASKLLCWMSRRWLYNIPRSKLTEGIRPLGRLVFVDHLEIIASRLNQILAAAIDDESVEITERNTGLKVASRAPRVFVVASIAGGTGGGAALDLAYLIRATLENHNLPDDDFIGILTHSSSRKFGARDLATANTYTCLSELNHYSDPMNGYSGVDSAMVPLRIAATPPFRETYFVHLGEELSQQEFNDSTDALSHYLYLNMATPAAGVFDKFRHNGDGVTQAGENLSLRTFGIANVARDPKGALLVTESMSAAKPRLGDCARAGRLLVSFPEREPPSELLRAIEGQYGASPMPIPQSGDVITICQELQQLSVPHLLDKLTSGSAEFERVANRLHTRVDVNWLPLSYR